MKRKAKWSFLLIFAMLVSLFSSVGVVTVEAATPTWIEAYDMTPYDMKSPNFTMKVSGTPVDVAQYFYKKDVRVGYSYAHLAYEGTATFEITCLQGDIEAVDASPHSYNMNVKIDGNKFTFDLTQKNSRYMVFDVRANGGSYQLIVSADPKLDLEVPVVDGKKVVSAKDGVAEIGVGGLNSTGNAASGKSNTEKIQKIISWLTENGGGTLYFPEGVYPFVTIDATSNVTLYLDKGAVLRGSGIRTDYDWNTTGANGIQAKLRDIRIINVKNFKIIGKGMVDANSIAVSQKGKTTKDSRELNNDPQPADWYPDGWNDYRKGIVDGENSENVEFKGVTFKDATGWTFNIRTTKNIEMNNVKMLDDYTVVHSDGYDIVSCQNVNVQNCFGVCGDDVFCPKGDVTGVTMENYLFKDCVAYAEGGAGCKIGVQARSDVKNIEFNNIDVIRGYRGFSIAHDEGNGNWEDIRFINIRTEKLHIPSFSRTEADNYGQYTATPFTLWLRSNGSVKDVEVTNCSFESISNMRAMLRGKSDNGVISNITFTNLTMEGRTVTSLDDPRFSVGSYIDKGSVKFNNTEVYAPKSTVYEAENAKLENGPKKSEEPKDGQYSGGYKVSNLGLKNDGKEGTATFTVKVDKAGEYDVEIYSITKGARRFFVTVNNGTPQAVTCNGDGWSLQGRTTTKLQLNAGENTIKLGNPYDAAPDLDKIEVITGGDIYDASSEVDILELQPILLPVDQAFLTLAGSAKRNDSGLIGYVGGKENGTITFHVQAAEEGEHILQLYYASAQNRTVSVKVNNDTPVTATCSSNGSWTQTGSNPKEIVVKLNAGDNTITIGGVDGGDAPNIGNIAVSCSSDDAQATVGGWIDTIPQNVTVEDKAYVNAVKKAYDSLEEKDKITNADKITASLTAIEAIEQKEAQAVIDQAAADAVKEKIANIQSVTLESEASIKEARTAYDALTDNQKALVDNVATLTQAEETYQQLKAAQEKEEADKKAAQVVIDNISQIGEVTLVNANVVEEARVAYDALTPEQQQLVGNIDILINAEETLDDLKAAEEDKNNSGTQSTEEDDNSNTQTTEDSGNSNTQTTEDKGNSGAQTTEDNDNSDAQTTEDKGNSGAQTTEDNDNSGTQTTEDNDNSGTQTTEDNDNSGTQSTEDNGNSGAQTTEDIDNSDAQTTEDKGNSDAQTTEDDSNSDAQTTEDKNSGTQTTEDKNAGSQTTEDKNAGSQTTEDKNSGTQTTEDKNAGSQTTEDKNSGTQTTEDNGNSDSQSIVTRGDLYTLKGLKYKVTNANMKGKGTVEVYGPVNKKIKKVTIPASIKIHGATFKVTSIRKNAFKNCTKLKKITIKTTNLKKVGKNALKGIKKNAKIKVPSSKLKKYKRLLKGKGQSKNVKITK